jgi:hypothetical protein
MIEGIAQVLLAIGALLLEITIWASVGLYVAVRAIASPAHREKIRLEWHSGWKGKMSLVVSGAFWVTVIGATIYIWFPSRSAAA